MLRLFMYDEIDMMRCNKTWWHPATKRYDEARAVMRDYMIKRGEPDPDETDCPDDTICDYCDEHGIMFDKYGEPWHVCDADLLGA